jgi:hypothetical protein
VTWFTKFSISEAKELQARIVVEAADHASKTKPAFIKETPSAAPALQHPFDMTHPLEQELKSLSGLSGVQLASVLPLTAFPTPAQKGAPAAWIIVGVSGRPVQQKFCRTGSIREGTQWNNLAFGSAPFSSIGVEQSRLITTPA